MDVVQTALKRALACIPFSVNERLTIRLRFLKEDQRARTEANAAFFTADDQVFQSDEWQLPGYVSSVRKRLPLRVREVLYLYLLIREPP
jgi:hypothetical protein